MNPYNDIYEPFNWTRFLLLIVLLCVTVFYYSTQAFIVDASAEDRKNGWVYDVLE